MSTLAQSKVDQFNKWFDTFVSKQRVDPSDVAESRHFIQTMYLSEQKHAELQILATEKSMMEVGEDAGPMPFAIKVLLKRADHWKLPLSIAAVAVISSQCNNLGDITMNLAVIKKQFELLKATPGEIPREAVDVKMLMMFFGEGSLHPNFYEEMWDAQKVDDKPDNLLDHLTETDFKHL